MAIRKNNWLSFFLAGALLCSWLAMPTFGADKWEALDNRVKSQVYQVNVAINVKVGDNYAQLADLSPRMHYPVFATTDEDKGFRVVGYGSCFPIHTNKPDKTYFLTNKHVVDFGEGMIQECERFFAAMRLHAERTAGFSSTEDRYNQLLRVVNLSTKKPTGGELAVYRATVDSIWDTYDNHLSAKADPSRNTFKKYLLLAKVQGSVGFFIHSPGASSRPPIVATLYKKAKSDMEPDLALLESKGSVAPMEFDNTPPAGGQIVQAIGYPVIKQSGVIVPPVYEPTFTTGRVKQVVGQLVQFDAPVSKGDSGGPLVNQQGRVVGVVVRRALTDPLSDGPKGPKIEEFAAAVSVPAVRAFAPELFGNAVSVRPRGK